MLQHVVSFAAMLDKLCGIEPFAFSRWGDGEWRSILAKSSGANCDGHKFFPQMGIELGAVLQRKPPYLLGMQGLATRIYGNQIATWMRANDLLDKLPWCDADVFHKNSARGNLGLILEAVRNRTIILVGPSHLKRLKPDQLDVAEFVEVPGRNAYLSKAKIIQDTLTAVASYHGQNVLIALSVGLPAGLILDELYSDMNSQGHSIVDFGSLWDPLVGVLSRKYHKNL